MSITENFFREATGGMLFLMSVIEKSYNSVLNWTIKFRNLNGKRNTFDFGRQQIDKKELFQQMML